MNLSIVLVVFLACLKYYESANLDAVTTRVKRDMYTNRYDNDDNPYKEKYGNKYEEDDDDYKEKRYGDKYEMKYGDKYGKKYTF